ncbi:MAG: 30S ribosomal protein S1 [Calditrichaeota bacterium]|nr:30S ribosomal protein S1 [Calditrichota bacterium]
MQDQEKENSLQNDEVNENPQNITEGGGEQVQATPETDAAETTETPSVEETVVTETVVEETPAEGEADTGPKTLKLEDLVEEKEYSDDEAEWYRQIYEQTLNKFQEGEIIRGRILAINQKEVSVDIGFKSEGVVPLEEFSNPEELKIGDEIEVYLDTVEDRDGQLVLSRKKADFIKAWEQVIKYFEEDRTIEGRIVRRIKGGMVVDIMGVDAFLPGSQIDVKPVRDFDALVGKTFEFKIVNVNQPRKNIVVSRRVLIEEGLKGQREKILNELEKGQILEGTVKNITNFGVFIDLGGVDGLLHINDLSWGRVSHPSEVVSLDEKIKVMVLDFDEDKTRISLGLKQLQPHPWENVEEHYPVGAKVTGKVVNIADYGAFVELEKGIEGLIHISEMSWTQHIRHPSQVVSLGDIVEAIVLNVEKDERKISLSLRQLEPNPWDEIEKKYEVGSHHKGIVRNLTNFGAFVELEEGIDGLVHISDLSWTKKVRHPSEVLKKGDEIEVVVLGIDRDNRRISLGYKQVFENPWDSLEQQYKPGTRVKGKIVRPIDKGLIVEIPEDVEGFVPISHLVEMDKPEIKHISDVYNAGDEVELSVIEFDKTNKRIVLSERSPEELTPEQGGTASPGEGKGEKRPRIRRTGAKPSKKAAAAEKTEESPKEKAADAAKPEAEKEDSPEPAETAAEASEKPAAAEETEEKTTEKTEEKGAEPAADSVEEEKPATEEKPAEEEKTEDASEEKAAEKPEDSEEKEK